MKYPVKIAALFCLLEFHPTQCAPNSFHVGGRARAPSSFWTARAQGAGPNSLPPAKITPEANHSAAAHFDHPANGFWPDPQAVRDFRKRLKDNKPVLPVLLNNVTRKEEREEHPAVFVHHADRHDTPPTTPPTTICASQEQKPCNFVANLEQIPNVAVVRPVVAPPPAPVPLEVLVHWIYDEENTRVSGSPLVGSGAGIAVPHPPPPPPPPLDRPPFLFEAPDDVVAEYFKIIMDEKLTKRDLKCALEAWKATLTPYLLRKYEESEAERKRMFDVERDLRAQRVARLSPLARVVADKIEAVRSNDEFTVLEEEHMIREIMQSVPNQIRDELTAQ